MNIADIVLDSFVSEIHGHIKELEGTLKSAQSINDTYQRDNSRLQTRLTEVEEDNKKLSHQIEDKLDQLRKSGL